ncbi:MAG: zinc-dependent metalloprotease, partial [Vulcanimicrobiaceae bacterium]
GKDLAQAACGAPSSGAGITLLFGGSHAGFSLDPMRSYYISTKALPKNDEITVNLTFSGTGALQTVPDTRGTPIRVHYSILEEPKADPAFVPRAADDRVGYFLETQKRLGDDAARTPFRRIIDRWDLTKGPIVFTMTSEVPRQYRAAVKRGILAWNAAFAKAGFPNAIRVDDPPSDPAFDADDITYNPIRWITQDRGSFAAATPHIADPLTGRILHATITIDGEVLRSLRRGFVDTVVAARVPAIAAQSPIANPALTSETFAAQIDPCLTGACEYSEGLVTDGAFAQLALNPRINENSAQTAKFIDEYLTATTMHEVGHALGLRHNFIAPDAYSLQEVENPNFTAKHGISASVMAYNPIDLAPLGKPQPNFFQTVLGPYDYFAIEYGYKPVSSSVDLTRIANRSTQHDLAFATDEDATGAWAIDPRVALFALSSDQIGWHAQRFQIADRLFATLDKRYPRDGRSYYDERMAFGTILNEYARSAMLTARWVGGAFTSRTH